MDLETRSKLSSLSERCSFVFAALFFYLLFGAILFSLIERGPRQDAVEEAIAEMDEARAELLSASLYMLQSF